MSMTTQEQYVQLAWNAVSKAQGLARDAERYAASDDHRHKAEPIAAAGALWADIARSYAAIAAVLPEPLPELPGDGSEF
jgi:hypothetical protein